jgi:hypothetical protein
MMQLAEACPRYYRCAVNACTLDSGYGKTLESHPADVERCCTLSRARRQSFSAKHPELANGLRFHGLTGHEAAGVKRGMDMTADERAELSRRGQAARFSAFAPRGLVLTSQDRPGSHGSLR